MGQRTYQLQELVNRLHRFDYYTCFSDDYSVTVQGRKNEEQLKEDIKKLKLSKEEKEKVLRVLGYRFDANYLENKEFYNCIADQPLWNENLPLKNIISNFLDM